VLEDLVEYQNSGLDALPYAAGGRPIYAAADGEAQELYEDDAAPDRLLLPLRKGAHRLRVQALAHAAPGLFFGVLDVPAPEQPLPVSRAELTLGVPEGIYPLFFRGGDGASWPLGAWDAAALLAAAALAALFFRGRARRAAAAVALAGVWFFSAALFAGLFALLVGGGVLAWTWRHFSGLRLIAAWAALGFIGFIGLAALAAVNLTAPMAELASVDYHPARNDHQYARQAGEELERTADISLDGEPYTKAMDKLENGNFRDGSLALAQAAKKGVKPVALPLPSYARRMHAAMELSTPERPLSTRLYYATEAVLWPLGLLWLFAALYCLADALPRLVAGWRSLRAELERLGKPRQAKTAE
jgi:hypothetical protein